MQPPNIPATPQDAAVLLSRSAMPELPQRDLELTAKQLSQWLQKRLPSARNLEVLGLAKPAATGFSNDTLLFDLHWDETGKKRSKGYVVRIEPTGPGVFPEYAGNRPFVAGDSQRNIDSRAWARLAAPATKEYHDDFDNHTALVLDTGLPEALQRPSSGEVREFEAAVSLCASVAFTISDDCLIDMMLTGPDLHLFDGRPRRYRLDNIHEILAGVEPHTGFNLDHTASILADHFYEVSEVIFVLLNWDEAYQRLLDRAAAAGCHNTVLMIDGSDRVHDRLSLATRPGNVRFISPDEVLTGRIRRL